MQVKTDIELYHHNWEKLEDLVGSSSKIGLFKRNADVFILACSIGVSEDSILEVDKEQSLEKPKNIPRNVISQNQDVYDAIEFLLQNAIINSKHIDYNDEERMKIAFDDEHVSETFKQWEFLIKFANYGMIRLLEKIEEHDLTSITNIIEFIEESTINITLDDDL